MKKSFPDEAIKSVNSEVAWDPKADPRDDIRDCHATVASSSSSFNIGTGIYVGIRFMDI